MNAISFPLTQILVLAALTSAALPAQAGPSLVCLIQPSSQAEIGTSVTGVIETMRVERGDMVQKGQVIAVLRNDIERAALDVAKSRARADADVQAAIAALEFAQQSTARAEDLVKKKFVSEQALDKTRTEERVALQKLAQTREQRNVWEREMGLAKSQLAQHTIVSPISGIVAERYLSSGERVEDRSIARVVSIDPLHVEVMVPAARFGQIKVGMVASVMPELPGASPVEATVKLVDKMIDGASNTFRVRLALPNPDHAIPAGPRCKVSFDDTAIGSTAQRTAIKPQSESRTTTRESASQPATPSTAPTDIEDGAIRALERWHRAWESQDLIGYLAAYTKDFKGSYPSRHAWIEQSEASIQKPSRPRNLISEARFQSLTEDTLRVSLRQPKKSGDPRASTLNSLLMVLEKGQWLIREEHAQR